MNGDVPGPTFEDCGEDNLNGWGKRLDQLQWTYATDLTVTRATRWLSTVVFTTSGPLGVVTDAGTHLWCVTFRREEGGEQGAWVTVDGEPFDLRLPLHVDGGA